MDSFFEQHNDQLLSLGFAFHGRIPKTSADPEKSILDLLPALVEDRKVFRMLLAWLGVVSELIHIERLKALSEASPIRSKLVLGVVALKVARSDRRWKLLADSMKNAIAGNPHELILPRELSDPYLKSKYGKDEEFAKFGVELATILPEDEKKILTLRGILRVNTWLRLRALMGANFRADVAYLFLAGVGGPAAAARVLGCSRDTAYRNWRALEEANIREILRVSA
jgi:hypothetical protein